MKLVQIVNEPTHACGNTIDHCYISEIIQNDIKIKVIPRYYSDHSALCLNISDSLKD